jgi:hypothetical protein
VTMQPLTGDGLPKGVTVSARFQVQPLDEEYDIYYVLFQLDFPGPATQNLGSNFIVRKADKS